MRTVALKDFLDAGPEGREIDVGGKRGVLLVVVGVVGVGVGVLLQLLLHDGA